MKKVFLIFVLWIVGFAGFGQENYSFRKPANKADSLEINLEYTKICLGKFYEQHDIGVYLTTLGSIVAGGSGLGLALLNNPSQNDVILFSSVSAVGGLVAIIGIYVNLDSYKWLNRARLKPVLTPSGAGVVINLDIFKPRYE